MKKDLFNRLPPELVLLILCKLEDAKYVCVSMTVCKNFRSIGRQVTRISFRLGGVNPPESNEKMKRSCMNPFHLIHVLIKSKPKHEEPTPRDLEYFNHNYVPREILNIFDQIRTLHIRLPRHVSYRFAGVNSAEFLTWRASFGRGLHSCVVLGAKSWAMKVEGEEEDEEEEGSLLSSSMWPAQLDMRQMWAISCLNDAATTYYLMLQDTVKKATMKLESVVVSDENGDGRLCMNKDQILEIRDESIIHRESLIRSVPVVTTKIWYLDRLKFPGSTKIMEGAMLAVITPCAGEDVSRTLRDRAVSFAGKDTFIRIAPPVREKTRRSDVDMVAEAFAGEEEGERKFIIDEAVRQLMLPSQKPYVMKGISTLFL